MFYEVPDGWQILYKLHQMHLPFQGGVSLVIIDYLEGNGCPVVCITHNEANSDLLYWVKVFYNGCRVRLSLSQCRLDEYERRYYEQAFG